MRNTVRPKIPSSGDRLTGWAEIANGEVVELAPPSRRFGARILDGILQAIILIAPIAVYVGSVIGFDAEYDESQIASIEWPRFVGIGLLLLWFVTAIGYEVVQIAIWGQTLGKRMTGIKVINALDGDVPGWGRSLGRWAIPGLLVQSAFFYPFVPFVMLNPLLDQVTILFALLLLYLSLTWDQVNQGWHDRVAGTLVIKQ